jgi:DNA polymerase III gamma/tau subunit
MSFYLTYRPKIISELDNQTVRNFLANLTKTDRAKLPHAYLLTGTRGRLNSGA